MPKLAKSLTGITGLDQITQGGIPSGRPTLVCGGPGCGKTILAMEFLVHGALLYDEPGLFVSFEENPVHLNENFKSLGYDLNKLIENKKLKIAHIELSRGEIIEAGSFSLDALLIRLEHGIKQIGAKRIVLDTLETLFSALTNTDRLRNEVARLFHWIRDRGLTAIITGERGKGQLTHYAFEEYISDCVILLDHRVSEQTSKRRLRIVKYRGSAHECDEFPFFIGTRGFSVMPITSLVLNYGASSERVSAGVGGLDEMLGGQGYFKATAVLIAGKSGTGKSSFAAAFAHAAAQRGERCLYFSFEESAAQITRNMKSVGIDLEPYQKNGLLSIHSFRPSFRGLEEHLVSVAEETERLNPTCVVMDPITSFVTVGDEEDVKSMLTRILDFLKRREITLLITALTTGGETMDAIELHLSSLVDTWIGCSLQQIEHTHRRTVRIVKSRGMEHSRHTHELIMSQQGLSTRDLARGLS